MPSNTARALLHASEPDVADFAASEYFGAHGGLTSTNIQVSIAVKKYKEIVAEMLHHLELSLLGYSSEQPAQAGSTFLQQRDRVGGCYN